MSERIDLTQFEDCDEGPWEYSEPSECIFGPLNEELDHYPILVNFPPTLYGVTTGEEYNNHPEVLKHRKVAKDGKVYHTESFWWGDRIPAMKANLKLMAAAPDLVAELKKMYAREDELLDALRIIRDDLNEGMAQGHLPIESTHGVSARKIRNFANDAFESFKRRESND